MASVDHIQGEYSLMTDETTTNGRFSNSLHPIPRTRSSPEQKSPSNNVDKGHTLTILSELATWGSRKQSSDSLTPLILESELTGEQAESEETAEEDTNTLINAQSERTGDEPRDDTVLIELDPAGEGENEHNDVLASLSEIPSPTRQKGILKQSFVISNSGGFSSTSSSPISGPTSPVSSLGQGRRESKVQFSPSHNNSPKNVKLQSSSDGGDPGSSRNLFENGQKLSPTTDEQLLSGSSIQSSINRLTKHHSSKKTHPPPQKKLQRLQSQLDLDDLSRNELELKANLYFHLGNPIKRWKVERVIPVKLLLQLLKTFVLIVQVIIFTEGVSHQRAEFFYNSRIIFESLFIRNFQDGITMPRDTYTAYSIQDMYSQFEYMSEQYFSLRDITIGGFNYDSLDKDGNPAPITMKLTQYVVADLNTVTSSYVLNGRMNTTTFVIGKDDNATQHYIEQSQDPLFHRFISLRMIIPVKNIRVVHPERAECFSINVTIVFSKEKTAGEITYVLEESHREFECNGNVTTETELINVTIGASTALDAIIILLSCCSIILTCKSLQRATKLAKAMGVFYETELDIKLSWWERRSLFPLWHLINTVSDLLILAGTIYKILVDYRVSKLDDANPTSLLLGTAILFQAMVILRYISYFQKLNALTRTIYLAAPELLKFLLCAGVLFFAFTIAGWIIIGPYHQKFVTFNTALETLFGLINGDDIYTTFIEIDAKDNYFVYLYSRFYMYIFLILFLYFVLNLFTSLVITAYEASQSYDKNYDNEVRRFVFSGPLTPNGVALRDVTRTKNYVDPEVIKKRLKRPPPESPQKPSTTSWMESMGYSINLDH